MCSVIFPRCKTNQVLVGFYLLLEMEVLVGRGMGPNGTKIWPIFVVPDGRFHCSGFDFGDCYLYIQIRLGNQDLI